MCVQFILPAGQDLRLVITALIMHMGLVITSQFSDSAGIQPCRMKCSLFVNRYGRQDQGIGRSKNHHCHQGYDQPPMIRLRTELI